MEKTIGIRGALHAGMEQINLEIAKLGQCEKALKEAIFDGQVLDCGKFTSSHADGFPRSLNFAHGYLANMNMIYVIYLYMCLIQSTG